MALLKSTRTVQYPLTAEFTFNFNDTIVDTVGVTQDFGSASLKTNANLMVIPLPPSAVVTGGEVVVETAYAGPTAATVSVGDSGSATRYGSAISLLAAARTALTLTGYRGNGENIQLQLNTTVANATAGKVSVRVNYIVTGRSQEVVIT